MSPDPVMLVVLAFGGLIFYGIWTAAHPPWQIKLVAGPEGLISHRGLPQRCVGRVSDFFANSVQPDTRLVVLANRSRNGHLTTKFRGHIDPGTRQRIRNYLLMEL